TITSNGGTEIVQVKVSQEVPALSVSPTSLSFRSGETEKMIDVVNAGTGVLTWTANDDRAWISLEPVTGTTTTETDQVKVTADLSSLGAGTYTGTITFTSNGGTKTLAVSASKEVPDLSVSTNELDFGSSETSKNFNVTNVGNGTLTWNISANKSWISVNPKSGSSTTQPTQIAVGVDRSSLSAGTFTGTITVTSTGGTKTISVSASKEVPDLSVTPTALDFGSNETSKTFNISNIGNGTLTWNISDDKDWISASPATGSTTTETDQIIVSVDRSNLSGGTFSGTVTVTSNGGTKTVAISVTNEAPQLSVNPLILDFGTTDDSKTFAITNTGTGTLTWNINDDRVWISVDKTSGSTTTGTDNITVTVNRGLLSLVRQSGTITVSSNGGTETVAVDIEKTNEGDKLVAYYPFNGNANDESSKNNNGTVYGAKLTTDRFGNLNSAYSFDGIDDEIDIPHSNNLNITGDLTICVWIKINQKDGDRAVIDKHEMQMYKINLGGGHPSFQMGTGPGASYPTSLNVSKWYFLVGRFNSQTDERALFLNGNLVASTTEPTTVYSNNLSVKIGRRCQNVSQYFNGIIDDIRIYNYALTESEISDLYHEGGWLTSGEFKVDANTVGLWHFNEGSGTTASDASGNGNDGQIIGASWTTQGKFSNALSFDGNDDRVQINSPFSGIQNTFTIELYFKSAPYISGKYIFSQHGDHRAIVISTDDNGVIRFCIYGTDGQAREIYSQTNTVENIWYHVVGQYDGQKMCLSLNGILEGTITESFDVSWSENYYRTDIGNHWSDINSPYSFSGIIDEVRISNVARYSDCIVPVELSSFNALLVTDGVLLQWQTKTETNNYGFEIERYFNSGWKKITFVCGNGTTSEPKQYLFFDNLLNIVDQGLLLKYRIKQIDTDGSFEYSHEISVVLPVPKKYMLSKNYPNPFNSSTTFRYNIPQSELVQITVYDALGRLVKKLIKKEQPAGVHSVVWDGRNDDGELVATGVYFYSLKVENDVLFLTQLYHITHPTPIKTVGD
ncbi:T9SS type A sorting domain-containing protein, partial [candidate division KSB1 bacterium]|nr:T9SS type A sorting domain-containing protein [candidate division KSB1 bacterium]